MLNDLSFEWRRRGSVPSQHLDDLWNSLRCHKDKCDFNCKQSGLNTMPNICFIAVMWSMGCGIWTHALIAFSVDVNRYMSALCCTIYIRVAYGILTLLRRDCTWFYHLKFHFKKPVCLFVLIFNIVSCRVRVYTHVIFFIDCSYTEMEIDRI